MAYPTNPIYKLIKNPDGVVNSVKIQEGNSEPYKLTVIPFDETNTDYQEYLTWVKEGGVAEAADSLTWNDIRVKRDGILKNTDWTMTTGATVDQAQWAAYRQVIRDIPQTYKDKTPDDVVWPTQPSTKGPNS